MPFIKPSYPTQQEHLRDILQNQLIPVSTVHDEVDYLVDTHLLEPIMRKVADMSYIKPIINKLGMPYLNFLFDIEYNENGSWSPESKFMPSEYPLTKEEHKAMRAYHKLLEFHAPDEHPKIEEEYIPIVIELTDADITEEVLNKILECDDGKDMLIITLINGKKAIHSKIDLRNW